MKSVAVEYLVGVPPRKLLPVEKAALEAGVNRATVFRWLRAGLLTRYHTPKGMRRRTLVDMQEIRRLRDNPPGEPVEEKNDEL